MNDTNNVTARTSEHAARAKRLQADWAIRTGLRAVLVEALTYAESRAAGIGLPMTQIAESYLRGRMLGRFGKEGEQIAALRELISRYDYLDNLNDAVFEVPADEATDVQL